MSAGMAWVVCPALVLYAALVGCNPVAQDADGGGPSDFPIHHETPSWSPDGRIAYRDRGIVCVESDGSYNIDERLAGIWIIEPTAGEQEQLASGRSWRSPSWSPEGGRLLLENSIEHAIYETSVDSPDFVRLTTSGWNQRPAWSPDGGAIAFESDFGVAGGPLYIAIHRLGGGEARRTIIGRQAAWSSDGLRVFHIQSVLDAGSEVFVMSAVGEAVIRLTSSPATDRGPENSPDGRLIAFSSQQPRNADVLPEIWIMDADGTHPRQLTFDGGDDPSWAPDGQRIVYTRADWRSDMSEIGVLWTVDVRTGRREQLTQKWPERCGAGPVSPECAQVGSVLHDSPTTH